MNSSECKKVDLGNKNEKKLRISKKKELANKTK